MSKHEYTVEHDGQEFRVGFTPAYPGTHLDPPEGPEIDIIMVDGMVPSDGMDEDDDLRDALIELCEEKFYAEGSEHSFDDDTGSERERLESGEIKPR